MTNRCLTPGDAPAEKPPSKTKPRRNG
jgi:hypothetical protein